jgi:CRP-like cAMP-binding protein
MAFPMLPGVEPCFFKKGQILIHSGQTVENVYYLKKGTVHREIVTPSGTESILSCKEGGGLTDSIVGILILYKEPGNARPVSGYTFVAMTDCYCQKIPAAVCKQYLQDHTDLLEQVVATAIHEVSYLMSLYLAKSERPAPSVLCTAILAHAEARPEGLYLPKTYSNIELSKLSNIHKVTISRILKALKEEGVIEKNSRGMHILDQDRMHRYAENQCQLDYR